MRALLLLVLLLAAPWARADTAWPPEATLTLVPDPAPPVVAGEMVLTTLRGEYVGNVAKETLEIPTFEGWSWMQLTPPTWSDGRSGTRATKVFEVRLAFFPQRAGRQVIGPILHHLTFAGSGQRLTIDAASAPVVLDVAVPPPPPPAATGMKQSFWMPARAVRVTDAWEPAPDRIAPGDWARRTVTLEVAGLPPEALPPAPPMAAGNLFSFADPEERSVRRTPDGPVSTIVWRYRMRPGSSYPADLDNIPVAWFDTGARVWREEVLRGAEITFEGTALPTTPGPVARRAVPVGLALGGLLGLGVLLPRLGLRRSGVGGRVRRWLAFRRLALSLRLAEAAGDGARARRALLALLRLRGVAPSRSAALARLDSGLFGRKGKGEGLPGLTRRALGELRGGNGRGA